MTTIDQQLLTQLRTYYQAHLEDIIAENIAVCEVAAPPFQELERARAVARRPPGGGGGGGSIHGTA
ncbi:MAG TPA: hypothetical protein DCX37_00860, partial [Firmicutes bacterium]|nr:hypothetical protein [Bacillota bacterium]